MVYLRRDLIGTQLSSPMHTYSARLNKRGNPTLVKCVGHRDQSVLFLSDSFFILLNIVLFFRLVFFWRMAFHHNIIPFAHSVGRSRGVFVGVCYCFFFLSTLDHILPELENFANSKKEEAEDRIRRKLDSPHRLGRQHIQGRNLDGESIIIS